MTDYTQPRSMSEFFQMVANDIGWQSSPPKYGVEESPVGKPASMFKAGPMPVQGQPPRYLAQPDMMQSQGQQAPSDVHAFQKALGLPVESPYGNEFDGVTARNTSEPNPADPLSYLPELQASDQGVLDSVMGMLDQEDVDITPPSVETIDQPVMNIGADFTRKKAQPSVTNATREYGELPPMAFQEDRVGEAMFLDALAASDAASRGVQAPKSLLNQYVAGPEAEEIEAMRMNRDARDIATRMQEVGMLGRGADMVTRKRELKEAGAQRALGKQNDILMQFLKAKMANQPKQDGRFDAIKALAPYKDFLNEEQVNLLIQSAMR